MISKTKTPKGMVFDLTDSDAEWNELEVCCWSDDQREKLHEILHASGYVWGETPSLPLNICPLHLGYPDSPSVLRLDKKKRAWSVMYPVCSCVRFDFKEFIKMCKKPCPECGGRGEIEEVEVIWIVWDRIKVRVKCRNCGATSKVKWLKDDAIKDWNKMSNE